MNSNFKKLIITLPLVFTLTGCIVIAGDDDRHHSWGSSSSDWEQTQRDNKANIADLEVGASLVDVKSKMGSPNINEAFSEAGQQYQVLFYRTRHKHSDGETTKDECTPLIFKEGVLTAWGQKAYEKL